MDRQPRFRPVGAAIIAGWLALLGSVTAAAGPAQEAAHAIAESLGRAAEHAGRSGERRAEPRAAAAIRSLDAKPLAQLLESDLVVALEHAFPARRFMPVPVRVKRFQTEFLRGARDPLRQLESVGAGHRALVRRWLATPLHDRVFVIGASHDAPRIAALQRDVERRGGMLFFYEDCRRLAGHFCADSEVGGFFGSAGHAVVFRTAVAAASPFVLVEAAAAKGLVAGEDRTIVFAPGAALAALADGLPIVAAVAVMPAAASAARCASGRRDC